MEWVEIFKWVAGVVAAIVATGLTFKFIVSNKKLDKSQRIKVVQNNNDAGGDIVGGNKTTNRK